MVHYETIDHTADLGIHVTGADVKQLFIHAGLAMFDLIGDAGTRQQAKERRISARGADWPDLMVAWLRELLYLWAGKAFLVKAIHIDAIEPFVVVARVGCVAFIAGRHEIRHDIKAATYHRIDVRQTVKGWESTIIFDV
jgi:SHS2 domain-containing protein